MTFPHSGDEEATKICGLTTAEVEERVAAGKVNTDANVKTRSVGEILHDNIVTLFNIVNVVLALVVFSTGSYKNMLFMVIIVANVLIGIIQELRSKKITDRLSIVAESKVEVIRNGVRVEIQSSNIVIDDVVVLGRGCQIPADGTVIFGSADVNESLLTGESDLIHKEIGSTLMSGSFINAGVVYMLVCAVGAESYANKISAEAKKHKKVNSEIMETLNGIVKYVSIALPFVGAALLYSSFFAAGTAENDLTKCVLNTVAALIGMIPEGLILLTSSVMALAVIRLSKHKVLVQQLYCIETLARVDMLCLDKTGTITTGEMEVAQVLPYGNTLQSEVDRALASIVSADNDPNETSAAIAHYYGVGNKTQEKALTLPNKSIAEKVEKAEKAKKGKKEHKEQADEGLAEDFLPKGDYPVSNERVSVALFQGKAIPIMAVQRYIPFNSDRKWSGAQFYSNEAHGNQDILSSKCVFKNGLLIDEVQSNLDTCNNNGSSKGEELFTGGLLSDELPADELPTDELPAESLPTDESPAEGACYVLGAGQFVLGSAFTGKVEQCVNKLAEDARVLVLARVAGFKESGEYVGTAIPIAFVCIHDKIRSTAADTISYFKEEGVTVKVISGDDPRTVSGIATEVGIDGASNFVDATTLKTENDIFEAMKNYNVFGRVKPEQKKQFVCALQKQGHTVAMTGDGVNDTLALKQSDCGVAMASGSDAARNVAHLVLVNNDFACMPLVVAEGRRSINNLQRSASLFLVKTLYSIAMSVLFVFMSLLCAWHYPFQPIQMTLVSAMTIGLPSFVLALEPNHDRVVGSFLENVIVRAVPGALCVVVMVFIVNILGNGFFAWSTDEISTLAVLLTAWAGIMLIIRLSRPFTPLRGALLVVVVAGMVLGSVFLSNLFGIHPLNHTMSIVLVVLMIAMVFMYHGLYNMIDSWYTKRQTKKM